MTIQELKYALEDRRKEKKEMCEKIMNDFVEQDMSEKSFLSGKRIVDRAREYIKAINFALNLINQLEPLEATDTFLPFDEYIVSKLKETQAKLHLYLPDSPNYNRLSGRIQAFKEVKEERNYLYHTLPDDLLQQVAEWIAIHENEMNSYDINTETYFYSRGYRNAIVDVFDILKQYGYDSKDYIPKE